MITVKPLEWLTRESRDNGRLQSIAHTIVGTYAVTDCTDLGFVEWLNRGGGKIGKCKTMDEAKAEAFADYSARIMSAIEPAGVGVETPPPSSHMGVVEALRAAEPYVEICHSLISKKDTRAQVWKVLKQIRAALATTEGKDNG